MGIRLLLAGVCTASLLAACAADGVSAPSKTTAAMPAAAAAVPAWAHEGSDLKADPAVRFGVLPNGMRYAIMKNATPATEASLRLRIDAGSLYERDDQKGVAHFLEHMVLNGTKNVPEGEFVRRLERAGLQFGPDTNASTGFDETIYKLDLPETDEQTVDTALFLLREVAGEATLSAEAIDRERGIIAAEERVRDTPQLRIARAQLGFLLKGQPLPERFPIGDLNVIRTAPRERFVEFYNAYYRPERATLVAVGDFDVDQMEAKIRRLFGDWRGRGAPGADPDVGKIMQRGTEARLFVDPGSPTATILAWAREPDRDRDTRAERRERLIRALVLGILNRRYERISLGSEPPFVVAIANHETIADSADTTTIQVVSQPPKWRAALAAAEQEQRRLVQYGVTQPELERAITETRAALTNAVAGAATRRTPEVAEAFVAAVNADDVITAPAEALAVFEETVKGLTPEAVSAAMKAAFQGQGPLVFMTSPTAIEGGEAALASVFTQSRQQAVAPPTVVQAKAWPYTEFGAPGRVAERREAPDLGATYVRFQNGVRLTVKPTTFKDDQILVRVRAGDGRLDQPASTTEPFWLAQAGGIAFVLGGLQDLTFEELQQTLTGKVYDVKLAMDDDAFVLSGVTRPEDFTLQMQVLAAYLTKPGWRPQGFDLLKTQGAPLHDALQATPAGVLQRDLPSLIRSGDRRWALPTREAIAASRAESLRGLLEGPLANEPVEVVIVGDITVDEAIARTAATFGALPARRDDAVPAPARAVKFPAATATPVRLSHKGRPDQAVGYVAWPVPDFTSDPDRARVFSVLSDVLRLRLEQELREGQAVTYSPQTTSETSWTFPGYGYVAALIEAPPEKLDGFFADVAKIARDLRDNPVSADELERARKPRVENVQRQRNSNEYWAPRLAAVQTDRTREAALRDILPSLGKVTPAQIQQAARQYLRDDRAWKLAVTPEAKASGGGS